MGNGSIISVTEDSGGIPVCMELQVPVGFRANATARLKVISTASKFK